MANEAPAASSISTSGGGGEAPRLPPAPAPAPAERPVAAEVPTSERLFLSTPTHGRQI